VERRRLLLEEGTSREIVPLFTSFERVSAIGGVGGSLLGMERVKKSSDCIMIRRTIYQSGSRTFRSCRLRRGAAAPIIKTGGGQNALFQLIAVVLSVRWYNRPAREVLTGVL
jgi:hypothetical protein